MQYLSEKFEWCHEWVEVYKGSIYIEYINKIKPCIPAHLQVEFIKSLAVVPLNCKWHNGCTTLWFPNWRGFRCWWTTAPISPTQQGQWPGIMEIVVHGHPEYSKFGNHWTSVSTCSFTCSPATKWEHPWLGLLCGWCSVNTHCPCFPLQQSTVNNKSPLIFLSLMFSRKATSTCTSICEKGKVPTATISRVNFWAPNSFLLFLCTIGFSLKK